MPDQQLHVRAFADLHLRESTTAENVLTGLCVPYGVPTEITELRNGRPLHYREQFVPGAFDRAIRVPDRVALVYDHREDFPNRLGHALAFRETMDGLEADFHVDPSRFDQIKDAVTTSHAGLSAGFVTMVPKPFTEREGQLITRKSVALVHVAAVAAPAYADARVQSIRAGELDLGEPTPADVEAEAQHRSDQELLAFFAQEADRWVTILS